MSADTQSRAQSYLFSDQPEKEYVRTADPQRLAQLGQYFTPYPIARVMAGWITHGPNHRKILDPAVGLGIFLRALAQDCQDADLLLRGFDIDQEVLSRCKSLLDGLAIRPELLQADYLQDTGSQRYDGILCNPPYQSFQKFPNRKALLAAFADKLGLSLSGLTNLHTLFLLKALHELAPGGRAAFIMPSDFLNADYGNQVKAYLMHEASLRYVIVFDSHENIFTQALTTACILLFAKDAAREGIEFIKVKNPAELEALRAGLWGYPHTQPLGHFHPYLAVDPATKWRIYYDRLDTDAYLQVVPFSSYANVMRGIATGSNDYFTFNLSKQKRWGIPEACFLPCLTKSKQARSPFLRETDFRALRAQDKRIYLLNAQAGEGHEAILRYLKHGEALGVQHAYLTSHRTPWYKLERRPPAPMLVNVFNRGDLRFVRNEAGLHHLTCFHAVYPTRECPDLDLLMAYLLTDVAKELFRLNRREYADGLRKYEPNDIQRSMVADLSKVKADSARRIQALYADYRAGHPPDSRPTHQLAELDSIFRAIIST